MARSNLDDIAVFIAVVEAESFIAGGRALGLSRSAAGKAVARLEDRLGRRLINRTTRSVSVTDEGRLLYDEGRKILAAVDEAESLVAGKDATPTGTLRITAPSSYGRSVLLPIIAKFLAEWPEVEAEVSFSDQVADIVDEGFDLAIRIGVTAPDTQLVTRVISRHRVLLCAAPAYLAEHGEPASVEELARHDALFFASRHRRHIWQVADDGGDLSKARLRSRLRLDSGEALRDAAVAGLGIALLPDFLVQDDLAAGRLRQVLAAKDTGTVNIVALYPTKRLMEPRLRRFLDLLVEETGHPA